MKPSKHQEELREQMKKSHRRVSSARFFAKPEPETRDLKGRIPASDEHMTPSLVGRHEKRSKKRHITPTSERIALVRPEEGD